MAKHSTREAAQLLGVSMATINRYVALKTIPVPPLTQVGGVTVRLWSDRAIAKARAILGGFADGRRTRHRKAKEPRRQSER